ncbi:MAG: glycosyltransferase family 4 protein [Candidatus Paceibacteria bacterium]
MEIGMYANIVPPEYGGGGGGASRYARKLADRGHNVTLFTKTESPDNIDKVEIKPIDRKYRVKGKNKLLKFVCFTLLFFNYLEYLWSNNFDVLHCYSASPHSLLFNATAKLVGIPTIVETTLLDSDDPVSVRRLRFGRVRLFL